MADESLKDLLDVTDRLIWAGVISELDAANKMRGAMGMPPMTQDEFDKIQTPIHIELNQYKAHCAELRQQINDLTRELAGKERSNNRIDTLMDYPPEHRVKRAWWWWK